MPNSLSLMIPDMLDWRQIWGSGRPRKGVHHGVLPANTIVITAEIESGFIAKDYLVPFRSSTVSLCPAPFQTRSRWVGVKGSTRNGRRDPKCPSTGRLRMDREDSGVLSEGAASVWVVADEAVGCTRAFLTMWRFSRRLVCRGHPEPGLHVNDISRIHWSQHLLTTQSEWPN
ncbi:uncharacterized protein TNCV_3101411 [Trichonephila clavipes]|nr:uncharacterized protein TNCV_3101411 [Trichonephila clavipes]